VQKTWRVPDGAIFLVARPIRPLPPVCGQSWPHGAAPPALPSWQSPRLGLERLEARDLPATTLFVVPLSTPIDATHFPDLTSALGAAAANDTIQVEPNSAPGGATVSTLVTIQGDPASTPGSLPQLGDLTIAASDVTLNNLNLHKVTINATFNHTTIANSLAAQIQDQGGSGNGFTTLRNNVITDAASLSGNTAGATDDLVERNVFARQTTSGFVETLGVGHADGTVIQGNTVTVSSSGFDGIGVASSTGVIIRNNTVRTTAGSVGGIVVGFVVNGGVSTSVTIADNVVQTGGTGIFLFKGFSNSPLSVSLSGNDVVNNKVGVSISGDGTSVGTVDLGGGSLGSAGNNDFHLFNGAAGHFAIQTTGAAGDTIQAQNNLFTGSPAAAISAPGETVNATARDGNSASVQRLYQVYLHRAAADSEVAGWLPLLASNRQAAINGIAGSKEAATVLVEGLYQRLLGRSAAGDLGSAGWAQMFQAGATQEQVIAGIVSSSEFSNRASGLVNAGAPDQRFVIALYHLVLGRQSDPSASEVAGWVSLLPSLGRAGVAQALLASTEYRTQTVTAQYFADPTVGSTGAWPSIPAQWVGSTLPNLLHRSAAPAPAEVAGWVNSGLDLLSIQAAIAASDESFTNG
jgi:hypothetical protein